MRPKPWRIVVYLVVLIGAIVLPAAVGSLLAFLGPVPYLLREEQLGTEWSAPRQFDDGSAATVHSYADSDAAGAGASVLLTAVPRQSTIRTPGQVRYTRRDNGRHGLLVPVGNRVVQVEGADDWAVRARFEGLPFILANRKRALWRASLATTWSSP
jgi:hypothetical protein